MIAKIFAGIAIAWEILKPLWPALAGAIARRFLRKPAQKLPDQLQEVKDVEDKAANSRGNVDGLDSLP